MPPTPLFFSGSSAAGSVGSVGTSGFVSLPTHSVMLTAQTGQDVLTAPATHFVVQEQVAGVSASPVSAIRSASST